MDLYTVIKALLRFRGLALAGKESEELRRTLHLAYGQYNPDNLQIPHPESLILFLNNFIIVTPRKDDTREEIQRSYWDHR